MNTIREILDNSPADKFFNMCSTISTKLLAGKVAKAQYSLLRQYRLSLNDTDKKLFDCIISVIIQHNKKAFVTRFNTSTDYAGAYNKIKEVIGTEQFNNLPVLSYPINVQEALNLLRGGRTQRLNNLKSCIGTYYPLPSLPGTFCKRCYSETPEELCNTCKSKIEKASIGQIYDFETSGTTIEAFDYQFKDWYVSVTAYGDYKFQRLKTSSKQYQPVLPFEEFKNLMILIG